MDVNEIELKVTDSFFFRRFEKINWKQIGNLFTYLFGAIISEMVFYL